MTGQFSKAKLIMICCCLLALSACNEKKNPNGGVGIGSHKGGRGSGSGVHGGGVSMRGQPGSVQEFSQNIGDRVYFAEDQTSLSQEAQDTLRKQAQWLQKYSRVTIQMEGHADERGTREYNIALSARRATAARQFLIAQGVAAGRVSSIAYGKERPVAVCDSEQCWSQNRRGVTVITGGAR